VHVEAGVSVGEALAEARGAAGLSVDELSERTAIREIVIRSIERDEFDSLGGDLYVRGYLRKIAGAVGIDPRPLIREFDAGRPNGSGGWSALGTSGATVAAAAATGSVVAPATGDSPVDGTSQAAGEAGSGSVAAEVSEALVEPVPTAAPDSEAEPGTAEVEVGEADDAAAEPYWAESSSAVSASSEHSWSEQGWTEPVAAGAVWADPVPPESADTAVVMAAGRASAISSGASAATASSASGNAPHLPAVPATRAAGGPRKLGRSQPRRRVRGWRWVLTISGLTVVVLAIVGVAAGEIISKVGSTKTASAAAAPTSVPTAAPSASAPPVTPSAVQSTPASKPAPTSTARPAAPARRLPIQADDAFGPDGLADGDNPQSASFAITSDASAPWQTNWYATADFGLLKHGTGLLLDMGKPVTITTVTIQLGDDWGANLQLRAGEGPDLSEMPLVASATDVGGQLTMRLKTPARARYVLIWFVKLPPSGGGTYTGSVYSVTVKGRP
jgi:cytoskeletal protein RodZ